MRVSPWNATITLAVALLFIAGVCKSYLAHRSAPRIGYTTMDLSNPYFIELARGVTDRSKELGIAVTVHDAKSDAASQVSAIENFITQHVDAIIVAPIDTKAVAPVLREAQAAGIRVINSPQHVEGADAWVSIIEFDYGRSIGTIAARYIRDHMNGSAKVGLLTFPESPPLIERANGIKAGLAELAPNASIVSEQSALTPEKGAAAAETMLQAHPDVRVIVGVNDAAVLGAYEVIKSRQLDDGKFALFGLDAAKEALARIRERGMYKATVDIDPYGTGRNLVDVTTKVIKNGPIRGLIKIPMRPVTQ